MRLFIATIALATGLGATMVVNEVAPPPTTAVTYAQGNAQPPAQPPAQINVEVNRGGRAWYLSPVWMAIGGIALVLIILLIVLAARGGGGGTTVVRG